MGDAFPNFMRQIRALMKPQGTFISQFSEFPTTPSCLESFTQTIKKVAEAFNYLWIYRTYVPSFAYEQAYLIASDTRDIDPLAISNEAVAQGISRLKGECEEYSPAMHHGFFAVSPRVFAAIDEELGELSSRIQRP